MSGLWPRPRAAATRYPAQMKVFVNGDAREVHAPLTIAELLASEGESSRRVAVEVNREIIPRSAHAGHTLAEGDHVEIIQAIGGG